MAITRRRALAFGKETTEGTALTYSSLTAYEMAIDPTISFDTPKKRRRLANRTLSDQQPIEGLKSGTMTFDVEFATKTSATAEPLWVPLVEACGFRKAEGNVLALPIGAISSGPFIDGESITGGLLSSSNAFGVYQDGCPYLIVENANVGLLVSGTTVTGGTSGASATLSANAITPGTVLKPYSERTYQVDWDGGTSVVLSRGDVIVGGTSGAQGLVVTASSAAASGTCEFMPVDGTGTFQDGESVTGVTSGSGMTIDGAPSSKYIPSLTMVLYDGERAKVLKGARGTFSLNAPVGEEARFSFTFTGCRESVVDDAIPAVTGSLVEPPQVALGGQVWIDDLADPAMRAMTLDVGAGVALRPSPSEASGYISARIGTRAVGGTINPEATSETALDIYEKARDAESFQVGMLIGSTSGRRAFINCPLVVADQVNDEDQDGMVHDAISFIAYSDTTDREEHEVVLATF